MTTDKQDSRAAFEVWHTSEYGWYDIGVRLCVIRYDVWQASREQALSEAANGIRSLK